jgi:hypothetical protein
VVKPEPVPETEMVGVVTVAPRTGEVKLNEQDTERGGRGFMGGSPNTGKESRRRAIATGFRRGEE